MVKPRDKNARIAKIDALNDAFDDLPDGAYFAAMDEFGVSADDLVDYADHQKPRNKQKGRGAPHAGGSAE